MNSFYKNKFNALLMAMIKFVCSFILIFIPGTYLFAGQICDTQTIGVDEIKGISGSSDSNVIGVGKKQGGSGQIWHYNGTTWTRSTDGDIPDVDLEDVEVFSATAAFAVGKKDGGNGTFLVYDGSGINSGWSDESSAVTFDEDIKGVWAYSATEVYLAGKKDGNDAQLNRCIGSWTCTDLSNNDNDNSNQDLEDVWGDSSNVYFLGKRGRLFIFDRTLSGNANPAHVANWTEDTACKDLSGNSEFRDLWGDGAGNIYLTGKGKATGSDLATVWKYDGSTCSVVYETATENNMDGGIYGSTSAGEIHAGGKDGLVIFSSDGGTTWNETTEGSGEDIKDVWVSDPGNAYYGGKSGEISTCTFTTITCTTSTVGDDDLNGISGSSDSNVIGVGKRQGGDGQIWHYDGTTWTRSNDSDIPNEDLKDVEVISSTVAFAVGNKGGGRGTFLVYDGADIDADWSDESSNLPAIDVDMLGVWSDTATEVFIGGKKDGNDGTMILCEDSSGWSCQSLVNNDNDNRNQDIEDVWGDNSDVYFLDKRGRLFIFDRSGIADPTNTTYWTEDNSCKSLTGNSDFRDLWGDGAGNIYLTGKGKATGANLATVWKYDGSTCSVVYESATENDMNGGIYGSTTTGEIYAGGKGGLVIFSTDNGATWSENVEGDGEDIKDVWVSNAGNVYYAAKGGDISTCIDTAAAVDHYAITYPLGTPGVTCEALAVRITAHEDATDHTMTVAPSSSTTITLSTSPATDGWTKKTGGGTFTPPNQYTFDGTETYAEFWLTETTATTGIDIGVTDGTATASEATEDPTVDFAEAVFRFFAGGVGETIGTQIAGKESDIAPGNQAIQLRSVITNTSTMACESRILNTQTIEMGYKCNNPTTCQGAPRVQIENAVAATFDINPGNDNTATVDATNGSYDNVDLDFGATGTATFSFDFNDVGQIQLFARETLAAVAPDPAITVFGTSNMFVVRPFGFDIDSGGLRAADWLDNSALDDSTGTNLSYAADADGSMFASAGHSTNTFPVTLRAVIWESADDDGAPSGTANDGIPDAGANLTDNSITPNFGQETANSELLDVTSGNVQPTNVGSLFFGNNLDFANGTITTNLAFDQVGIIDLTASLVTGDYLSGGANVTSTHQNFGRFIPDRFTLSDNSPTFENGCVGGGFTYMEDSFYYGSGNEPAITITAVNENGDTTVNYGDGGTAATDYWKLPNVLTRVYDDNGVNNGSTFNNLVAASVIATGDDNFDGVGVLTLSNTSGDRDSFMFDRDSVDLNALAALPATPGTLEGTPFTASVDLLIQVTAGSLTDTDDVCYDGDADGTCETDGSDDYTALTDTGGTELDLDELRFGRFNIGTAVGSELLVLSPSLVTEYFDGNGFVINTDDSNCTFSGTFELRDHLRLQNPDTASGALQLGDATMTISSGTTSISLFNSPVVSGDTGTAFSAPAAGNIGFVDIFGNLGCNDATACVGTETYNYLRYDWDDAVDGDGPYDDEPSGRVDFGLFEGPSKVIYIREPW